jgi:DNA-binding response OmpR family regulator
MPSRRIRILIVEDNSEIRRLLRWTLEMEEFEIHEASNGVLGLQQALALPPDLMIVDRMMPGGLDGLQLTAEVRANATLVGTRILMLTAMAAAKDRAAALDAGVDDFLPKPFSPAALTDRVIALLAKPKPAPAPTKPAGD